MSNPFVAEIRIFPFNFAPKGWAFCDGQLLSISQNTALFSLLGTFYGGDGKSNFALPNLQGTVPLGTGQGPGLSQRFLGEQSGSQTVTLLNSEMPAHSHGVLATNSVGTLTGAPGNALAKNLPNAPARPYTTSPASATMDPLMLGLAGGSQPHNNLQPFLTLNYCIALQGVYPPRS